MIFLRIGKGIKSHWHVRATEWAMIYPAILIGIVLLYQTTLFTTMKSFRYLDRWMDQPQWALFVLICALMRAIALTVNGTFDSFRYSPHLRLAASFAGIAFWSQFTLGFLTAALVGEGSWTAPAAYSTMCLFELLNIYRAWVDVMRNRERDDA